MEGPQVPSDGTVIAAVLAGDGEAFAHLVQRYQGPLMKLAKSRLGRRDWAEDAVQEAFLSAYRSLASYDSRYSFRTWLWTILLHHCHRQHQRRTRQQAAEEASTRLGQASARHPWQGAMRDTPSDAVLAQEQADQLSALLAELPEEQADALRLRFFGALKFQEIADVQGCSLSSAKNRVRWGLLKMGKQLSDDARHACDATFADHEASDVRPSE